MVFKRPYAFIIKHFKLINFILATIAVYVAYRSYNIVDFFNTFVVNNYTGSYYANFYADYISPIFYLALILIIAGLLCIIILFVYKKKPSKFYFGVIIYYIALLIFITIVKSAMISMETTVMDVEVARIYRDMSLIFFIPQVITTILLYLRGFGLNIKKLNFEQDLRELEVYDQDSEEVEITFKADSTKIVRFLNRFKREFKVYIKENKFIFVVICVVAVIVVGVILYKTVPEVLDKDYDQGDSFIYNDLTYSFDDSILTNLNYTGEILTEDYYYLVVRVYITNDTASKISIDYNDYRLEINGSYIYPSVDQGSYFIDYARNYYSNEIKANSTGTYSLVYKIDNDDVKKNYTIKISNGTSTTSNGTTNKYIYVSLTPVVINTVTTQSTVTIGDTLNFNSSNLGNSTLTFTSSEITDKYFYDYESCSTTGNCNTYKGIVSRDYTKLNTTLIVADYEFELDDTIPYYTYGKDLSSVLTTFGKIKYVMDGETYTSSISVVTPSKLSGTAVIETTNQIESSDEVYLSITIRNKEYLIKLF